MGDAIDKLPVDDTLEYTQKDVMYLKKFFDTTVQRSNPATTTSKCTTTLAFVAIVTLMYLLFSHPSGPIKFWPTRYQSVGGCVMFATSLGIYAYISSR